MRDDAEVLPNIKGSLLGGVNHDAFKLAVLAVQPDATYIVDGIISSEN